MIESLAAGKAEAESELSVLHEAVLERERATEMASANAVFVTAQIDELRGALIQQQRHVTDAWVGWSGWG